MPEFAVLPEGRHYAPWLKLPVGPESYIPRPGQTQCWNCVATAPDSKKDFLFELPTGYGKTDILIGCYGVSRSKGAVNRLLIIVSNRTQRRQMQKDILLEGRSLYLGVQFGGVDTIDKKQHHTLSECRRGLTEVVIVTYTMLLKDWGWFEELLATGDWMVVRDEVHHSAQDNPWGEASDKVCNLPSVRRVMNLSATPIRADNKILSGVSYTDPSPDGYFTAIADVTVSRGTAIREGAIRPPIGFISNYKFHAVIDGRDVEMSTEFLKSEGITDYQAFETKRQVRYQTKYVDRMLRDAIEELNRRLTLYPGQHQGIIWSMSQAHANSNACTLNEMYKEAGYPHPVADWVGVSRSDADNDAVMDRYTSNKLLWLVQVNKAGEGFNNPLSSVLVFMNLVESRPATIQNVGRGMRRNKSIPREQDTCAVFASSDSSIADVVRELEEEAGMRLSDRQEKSGGGRGVDGEPPLVEFPEVQVIDLDYDRTDIIHPTGLDDVLESNQVRIAFNAAGITLPPGVTDQQLQDLRRQLLCLNPQQTNHQDAQTAQVAPVSQGTVRDVKEDREIASTRVRMLTQSITHKVMKLERTDSADRRGQVIRFLHTRWVEQKGLKHEEMSAGQLRTKAAWLHQVDREIVINKRVPSWLR